MKLGRISTVAKSEGLKMRDKTRSQNVKTMSKKLKLCRKRSSTVELLVLWNLVQSVV